MARRLSTFATCLIALLGTAAASGLPPPPETPVETIVETHFGTFVDDRFRWLEDLEAPATRDWFIAQDAYARDLLARLPGREALRAQLAELSAADTRMYDARWGGERLFYLKRGPNDNQFKLYWRQGLTGAEKLLVDPTRLDTAAGPAAIGDFAPSPNGKRVVFGSSVGGSEDTTLAVLDVDSGATLGAPIPRADLASLSWRFDSTVLYYNQLPARRATDDPADKYRDSRAYARSFGVDGVAVERAVLGRGLAEAIVVGRDDIPNVHASPVSSYAIGSIKHGDANELSLYAAPLGRVDGPATPWRKVVDRSQGVIAFELRGEWLYLLTSEDAPGYQVRRWSLASGLPYALAQAEVVLPAGERIVTGIGVASDALYVTAREAGYSRLLRLEFNVKTPSRAAPAPAKRGAKAKTPAAALPKTAGIARGSDLRLPYQGAIQELRADPLRAGALLRLSGWTESPAYYLADGKSGAVTRTALLTPSRADFSNVTVTVVRASSHDGVAVPLSIIHAKGAPRDGRAPLLIDAYGAYGISQEPYFQRTLLAWLERGGVFAVAHVRGGGELGKPWHLGGQKATKPNTWRDVIACADYLVRERWTTPERLALSGGSAGGIAVGGALIERPGLFRAVVSQVGIHDALRAELGPNGPPNIEEFGSVETLEGFTALQAMSSYHRVQDGIVYPAALFTTGYNDPRVEPWQPGKMAARLQAASAAAGAAGRPVLLRVDFDGGHGIGATQRQALDEQTDVYSFLLWQLGDPAFALVPGSNPVPVR